MDPIITIALSLLALIAAMFLLAKTRSEMLGKFFKFVSYTVVTLGFLCVICAFVHAFCGMACRHHGGEMREKQVMIMKGGHDMPPCCDMATGKCSVAGHAGMSASCCADIKASHCKVDGKGDACCKKGSKDANTAK